MADTKVSALAAATSVAVTDELPANQAGTSRKLTITQVRGYLPNASTTGVAGAYNSDTYIAGSALTISAAGGWKVGTIYRCVFDMTKTAAGTAAATVIIRMGTAGTTGDAAILTHTFGAGTAVADTGIFEVRVVFRSVGSGTAAVIASTVKCDHLLAATGLTVTGAAGSAILAAASAGFNSTTQSIIGVSFNGGASFSGTNVLVDTEALGI